MRNAIKHRTKQQGAVALTFAVLLVFVLGFMGLALDFGHAFVVKTELQTAMDACALSAAQELDGQTDSITRATNAGISAGNINRVNLQSPGWSGQQKLGATDLSFFDSAHGSTTDGKAARYVRCDHVQTGTRAPLLGMLKLQFPSSASAATIDVRAFAEATTTPAQSTCPLPLALVAKNLTKPSYGFERGEWVTLITSQSSTPGGQIGWANLTGGKGASSLADQLIGYCGSKAADPLINGKPGTVASLADYWNTRFGIYQGNKLADVTPATLTTYQPDFTGYGFTSKNWNAKDKNGNTCCAYDNNAYVKDSNANHHSFKYHRLAFSTCLGTASSSTDVQADCGVLMGFSKLVTGQYVAVSGGTSGALYQYGTNRRVAPVPVVGAPLTNTSTNIIDFACMLMLQPLQSQADKTAEVYLEFLGSAADPESPCKANGLPGGTTGPLVPVLVR